jgi:hypothetical protein
LASYYIKLSSLDVQHKTLFSASLFASIPAALGLSVLLLQEQQRSHRSSALATLYLLASILCDAVHVAMPSKIARDADTSHPVFLRCCMHSALLVLEFCANEAPAFSNLNKHRAPEELHGVLGRLFFTWVNTILLQGYKSILVNRDLPNLSQHMKPEFTRKEILQAWSQRG